MSALAPLAHVLVACFRAVMPRAEPLVERYRPIAAVVALKVRMVQLVVVGASRRRVEPAVADLRADYSHLGPLRY